MSPCDPTSEALAGLLEARSQDITQRWSERVRRALSLAAASRGALLDTLPDFLVALGEAIRGGLTSLGSAVETPLCALAEAHGRKCFHQGHDSSRVVREHSVLREVILDVCQEGAYLLERDALRLLLDALALAVAEALRGYAQEREQSLRVAEAKLRDLLDRAQAEVSRATRTRRMERERDEAREHLSRVLGSLPVIFWSFDQHGVFSISDGQGLKRIGFKPGQLVGQSAFDVFKDDPTVIEAITRALRGESFTLEKEYRQRWLQASYVPERGPDGAVVGVSGLTVDITERRQAEAELRQSETRYRLALQATSDAVWDWDLRSNQVHWSENLHRLTGRGPGEVGAALEWWSQHIHPEDRERVVGGLSAFLHARGAHWMDEYRFRRGDGSYMVVNNRGYVVRDARGEAVRMVGALQDISVRKADEQEAQRRSEFEQHLIGIVSHDLRNPLNAISMAAKLLLKQDRLNEPQGRSVQRIVASAARATRMLRDLLDFTQARLGGSIPVTPRTMDLHELTRQVTEEVQLAHPNRRLLLEQSGDGQGAWDEDRLAQLITNLVNNALTYGDEHGAVRVRTQGQEEAVVLSVNNTGTPISPELISQLFQPLKRGVGPGPQKSHSIGLGLFIVKHIVDAHGGHISVNSNVENGTTFTVSLPRISPKRVIHET